MLISSSTKSFVSSHEGFFCFRFSAIFASRCPVRPDLILQAVMEPVPFTSQAFLSSTVSLKMKKKVLTCSLSLVRARIWDLGYYVPYPPRIDPLWKRRYSRYLQLVLFYMSRRLTLLCTLQVKTMLYSFLNLIFLQEKVEHNMVTVSEHLQALLVPFEHQTKILYICVFVLPDLHSLVFKINVWIFFTYHGNDILPSFDGHESNIRHVSSCTVRCKIGNLSQPPGLKSEIFC